MKSLYLYLAFVCLDPLPQDLVQPAAPTTEAGPVVPAAPITAVVPGILIPAVLIMEADLGIPATAAVLPTAWAALPAE